VFGPGLQLSTSGISSCEAQKEIERKLYAEPELDCPSQGLQFSGDDGPAAVCRSRCGIRTGARA